MNQNFSQLKEKKNHTLLENIFLLGFYNSEHFYSDVLCLELIIIS